LEKSGSQLLPFLKNVLRVTVDEIAPSGGKKRLLEISIENAAEVTRARDKINDALAAYDVESVDTHAVSDTDLPAVVFRQNIRVTTAKTQFQESWRIVSDLYADQNGQLKSAADGVLPDVYVRGAGIYTAKLNAENPIGTMQSIEHTLRAFEDFADQDRTRIERDEKALSDYRAQSDKPFEHELKLKELVARQQELNKTLDLDKSDKQVVEKTPEEAEEPRAWQQHVRPSEVAKVQL